MSKENRLGVLAGEREIGNNNKWAQSSFFLCDDLNVNKLTLDDGCITVNLLNIIGQYSYNE
jgi:hypothetical protein